MAKKGARELAGMICTMCKSQNYVTERNKINMGESKRGMTKLELKKYCKNCGKVQLHKETSKLK